VKDSNLRSFRDGFTDRTPHGLHLHKQRLVAKFRTYSAQTAIDDRCQPDIPGLAMEENPMESRHRTVQPVASGTPYALTLNFFCR
jgi:hypothetical protein